MYSYSITQLLAYSAFLGNLRLFWVVLIAGDVTDSRPFVVFVVLEHKQDVNVAKMWAFDEISIE